MSLRVSWDSGGVLQGSSVVFRLQAFPLFLLVVVARSLERLRGRTLLFVVVKKIVGRVLLRGNR